MKPALRRTILRAVHLVLSIPVLGYIYGKPEEVAQYANFVRGVAVPVILLTGFWMYAGVVFAVLGVALWIGIGQLVDYNAALAGQFALFIAWNIWRIVRKRQKARLE